MATCPTCRTRYDQGVEVCATDGSRLLPDEAFTGADVDLKEGAVVGEYRIETKLGAGGFGTVYRAQHPVIGKTVAIKVLAREFSSKPEMVARFIDEARAVNQIRHKGIIDIFAFGSLPDGRHYFVMELLEGMSLDAYLRQKGRLTLGEALPILRAIARAVDAAHQAGIAHRDLKPDNVFLVFDPDGSAHTKLLDFGVAKLLSERSGRTQTGTPIGTPQYMSPEQSRGVNVDARTDVYSFGAMIYEMLTGRVPFEGATVMDTLVKQMSEQASPPSTACSEVPAALDAPILRMLEKDAAKRPQTLTEATEELAAAAGSAGIPLPPQSEMTVDPSVRAAVARTLQAPRSTPAPPGTLMGASTEIAPPPRRKRWIVVPVVLAVLALGISVGRHAPRPPSGATPQPTTTPVATTTTSASPANEEVEVTIDSQPRADIYDGSDRIGVAPGKVRLAKRAGTRRLTLQAAGFVTRDIDVDTTSNNLVSLVLVPVTKQTASAMAATAATGTAKPISTELEKPF